MSSLPQRSFVIADKGTTEKTQIKIIRTPKENFLLIVQNLSTFGTIVN